MAGSRSPFRTSGDTYAPKPSSADRSHRAEVSRRAFTRPLTWRSSQRTEVILIRKQTNDGLVTVTFILPSNVAGAPISVVGNFNDWQPYRHPLIYS